ncbi:MAG: peptidoglycan-binding protein [Clostridia bacterium]|nr:peptidoglycan-binding protein [Clostridia bacterium]
MDSIMSGGHTGSMQKIVSNLIDMIPHETLGARWVQCCLSKLGYYTGTIDGKYGERTEQAVKKFQKAYGFQERNYVTLGVARAMLEACYNNGCYLDDLP